jgi:hypothetical protein
MHLWRDKLTVSDPKLVEVAVDLAGSPRGDNNCRESVADLVDDIFELHGFLKGESE